MTPEERFKRLALALNLSMGQMAELFGCHTRTCSDWFSGKCKMRQYDFQQTLLRLEGDHLAELSPHLSPKTIQAFRQGRLRAKLEGTLA